MWKCFTALFKTLEKQFVKGLILPIISVFKILFIYFSRNLPYHVLSPYLEHVQELEAVISLPVIATLASMP